MAAWVELAELLRDPDYIAASRRMAERALAEGPQPDPEQFDVGRALGEHAGEAVRSGVAPDSDAALTIIERLEAMTPGPPANRAEAAGRIEAFTGRRAARYWTLVGIVNGWASARGGASGDLIDAWEWCAKPLRAHA